MKLYPANLPFGGRPIAWFKCSLRGAELASLSLEPEAEVMINAVIASLIVVEQKYRVQNKSGYMQTSHSVGLPIIPS